jgi:hypothetical protein
MHTYYIKLQNQVYPIRAFGDKKQVYVKNDWMDHETFVDYLMDQGSYGQVADLCRAACILKPEEVKRLFGEHQR